MKLRKITSLILILCLMFTIVLTGCNKEKEKASEQQNDDKQHDDNNVVQNEQDNNQSGIEETNEEELPSFIKEETDETVTYLDPLGNEVVLSKNPEKVVSLYASFTDLWVYSGGKITASVSSSSTTLPEGTEDLGKMSSVSTEKLIALEPDLVILSSSMSSQTGLKDLLEENNIDFLYVHYDLYDDFIDILNLMTRLNGTESIYEEKVKKINKEVIEIIEGTKEEEGPKVLIMFATSKSVSCEIAAGTTGNMVEKLGGKNILEDVVIEGETRVDYSPEKIVESDPDIIFIKTMGDIEACKAKMKEDVESSEMWSGLRAVKEGKIYYLPKDLFMSKPNERFPEAFQMLADYMYGE